MFENKQLTDKQYFRRIHWKPFGKRKIGGRQQIISQAS